MKKFGLIGHPIARSLSPGLFKAAYGGKYPYELIQGEDFETSYQRFLKDYDGINVTAPFKELAYAKADIISDECRIAGATNLLVKTSEGIKAYNSDLLGVRLWLQETLVHLSGGIEVSKRTPPTSWAPPPAARGVARFSPTSTPPKSKTGTVCPAEVLVVGCGGAGRAAAAAAVSLGLKCILMNRDITRAEKLQGGLAEMGYVTEVRPIEDFCRCFKEADIIIYNIPTAIPQLNELTDSDFVSGKEKYILEANYKDPSFNDTLINRISSANPMVQYTGGRTWLLYQALTGYEIFTGERPDLAGMSSVL